MQVFMNSNESRWEKSGRLKTTTGEKVFFSGVENDSYQEGVAVIVEKGMENHLMEWKPVNSRIIRAQLKGGRLTFPTYSTMHLLMSATTDIKNTAMNSCKGHLEAPIVGNSCWRWHQGGLRQLEF